MIQFVLDSVFVCQGFFFLERETNVFIDQTMVHLMHNYN